jgi:zinc protease
MEDEDQRGLAHFVEHLAFGGTENFPGDSLWVYKGSVGFGRGAGLNASVGHERALYTLATRTDNPEQLDKSFLILRDWASRLLFDEEAVERERLVIMEEWRQRDTGMMGMRARTLQAVFAGTRFADRMPIGIPEVIQYAPTQRMRDFFHDWYRPDLMAVVAVGDFHVENIREIIYYHFNDKQMPENPREIMYFPSPDREETLFALMTDPEVTFTFLELSYTHPRINMETIEGFRKTLLRSLLSILLHNRFAELASQADPPFLQAGAMEWCGCPGRSVISKFKLFSVVNPETIAEGSIALITEIERAIQQGFHQSELSLAKEMLLMELERAYLGQATINTNDLVGRFVDHFLFNHPLMSEEQQLQLVTTLFEDISLDDIQETVINTLTDENRVVALFAPSAVADYIPTEEDYLYWFETARNTELEIFPETVIDEPLMTVVPRRVRVRDRAVSFDSELGVYTWTLGNGGRVHLKQTDFTANEILFNVIRTGGVSQASDDDIMSASFASDIVNMSGFGQFDRATLDRYLSVRDISFDTSIIRDREQISGNSSIRDLETAMQLIWLTFNQPRFCEDAFELWRRHQEFTISGSLNDPRNVHAAEENRVLFNNHPRERLGFMSLEYLTEVNHRAAFDFYRNRFEAATDFDFIFVGDISRADLHNLIEIYVASLPRNRRADSRVIDHEAYLNQETTNKTVYMGDQITKISYTFTSDFIHDFNETSRVMAATMVLALHLLQSVREEIGGVYQIQPMPSFRLRPVPQVSINIFLYCDPERIEEIEEAVFATIGRFKDNTFEDRFFQNYKEMVRQGRSRQELTNSYWLSLLRNRYFWEHNSYDLLNAGQFIQDLTREDIVETITRYICFDRMLRVVLFPE